MTPREELTNRIHRDVNEYQESARERFKELWEQELISEAHLHQLYIDAKMIGQAVRDALSSHQNYPEEVTEIYVYSLFDKYKESFETKFDKIKKLKAKKERRKSVLINTINDLKSMFKMPLKSAPENQGLKIEEEENQSGKILH
ncbi:hypothetical protein PCC9214_03433 [Planktothrix tepida]|uniref:Uncharacterized protein n=2 Tax=Planktothrix TaxID=54304 RepID=A0A1J1LT17_9CYAN|nr:MULTISPECIES: hypothetical protein [Planktothrix]CAD5945772.1 hypothetical protein NO713_02222 [Planktothrix pseudagardhii]CAD5964979.1 hypothetical protein PCC9214_03433 [Planktothrix tepida]CUR34980.1 hypothetical protein PL9214650419 [Planktothrix tepida PCC 9214]